MSHDPELNKLRWRCRRGMRELDMLLLGYVNNCYRDAAEHEQQAFRRLLTVPDPDILALLTGRTETDDDQIAYVIKRLLERP